MEYSAEPQADDAFIYAYRIVAPRWAHDAFSGAGAKKYGGRWNSPGQPVIYLGGSRALAALEMLVHLTTPLARRKIYKLIQVAIPKDCVAHYPISALPKNWRESPAPRSSQEIGDDWLSANSQLALALPSVLIPEETNIILNPLHPDIKRIVAETANDFHFDSRLY
ncbi:RES family NAD+ phosphorylase [Rubritalea sp.]|uniref:RES family NAD+ phosphorylase n=1 Tax=Rubritalea sp. TaxID=2109375 RepID=UPI003EF295DE